MKHPEGATHQHKDTLQYLKVVNGRVFRLDSEGGWILSSVDLDEVRRRTTKLDEDNCDEKN